MVVNMQENEKVLLIDNKRDVSPELEPILVSAGLTLKVADNTLIAVELLNDGGYKAIFVSLCSGFSEGLRSIRGVRLTHPETSIVAILNSEDIGNISETMKAGATEYLPRPFKKESVLNIIKKISEKQQLNFEYSKLFTEGLEYMNLLNLYQKCMKILVTTDINSLALLLLGILIDISRARSGVVWCSTDGNMVFKKIADSGTASAEKIPLDEREIHNLSQDGIFNKDNATWVSVKGNTSSVLTLIFLDTDKTLDEKEKNLIKSIMGFAGVAFDNSFRATFYNQSTLKDSATGAYSFYYLADYVEKELSKSKRFKRNLSLILLRIENISEIKGAFSEYIINSTFQKFVGVVFDCVRGTDIVAKKEENEYYVLLPETDYFGSLITVRRLISALKGKIYMQEGEMSTGFSLRISSGSFPKDGGTLDMLLYKINKRMEEQKKSLFCKFSLEDKHFWDCVDILLAEDSKSATASAGSAEDPMVEGISKQLAINEETLEDIIETLADELSINASLMGAFFVKLGEHGKKLFERVNSISADPTVLRIYNLEVDKNTDAPPFVRNIKIPEDNAGKGNFFIAVTEDFSYGLFFRKEQNGKIKTFHTSDTFIIENLIAKLQDKYLGYREL